ncbi:MAG TPA: hypothetical protein VIK26_06565, partial [Clostridium sp.]
SSIIHLMRGQVFNIEGRKFFCMGGGTSVDKADRIEGKSWWQQEIPSEEEFETGLRNLKSSHWNVDYVLTHSTSTVFIDQMKELKENSPLIEFLNMLEERLEYRQWYFGHFHRDCELDAKNSVLYQHIVRLLY